MRYVVALLAVLLLGCDSGSAANSVEEPEVQFQAILDDGVKAGLMAVSARVSWAEGSWAGVAGETSADSEGVLDSDSRFRIASITKLFTATVVLQLVDEKVLQLSDTLADRLPEGPAAEIPYADDITIGMLLNHTSGIHNFSAIDSFWSEAYSEGGLNRVWEPEELIRYALQEKPYFKPGSSGEDKYSNTNYVLLGMIIERITGSSLAAVYRSRIYEPLELNSTLLEGFDPGMETVQHSFLKAGFRSRFTAISRGWNRANAKGLYDASGNYKLYNGWSWAAGGISSTTGDLHRFLLGLRDGSLLSDKSQELLFRNNSAEGNAGVVFGGSGGWEGITTSAYEIGGDIRIVILINTTGLSVNADTMRSQLYRVLRLPK